MTLRVCLCVSLLLSTATVCLPYRFLQSGPRSSIVGGEDAPLGRWPWMVYQYITDGRDFRSCGGSLVSKQWVLTAAHCILKICVEAVKCSHSYVRLGELKLLYATGVRHTIHRYLLHPNYHFHKKVPLHDIAMLKLAKPVHDSKTVAPVPLPGRKDIFSTDSECWVTGWGYVAYNEPLGGDETLQQVQLPLVNDTICRKTYPGTNNNHLCAGYLEGGKDACMVCEGDSGGPLVCKSFEVFVQVGVVSYGVGCGDRGYPGVYTRVYNYMQFIEDSMHKYR